MYHFPPGFIPTVKTHGNAKSDDQPFHPTWASTKQHIKQKCVTQGPDGAVACISTEADGIVRACAPGKLSRNAQQVSNYKTKAKLSSKGESSVADDDLFLIMQQAYTDNPLRKFIHAVNAAPEPAIVVATNSQLRDLSRFSFEFSIVTVDPTFCLVEFDVTLITQRHLLLQSKRFKQAPVLVGLVCFH